MNQLLSTCTINTTEYLMKEIKIEIEKIPDYLTKRNQTFQQIRYQILSKMPATTTATTMTQLDNTNKLEDLRKIAMLIYKIMIIQTYQLLWTTCLKSGMGRLIIPSKTKQQQQQQLSYSTTLSIWPKEIKSMVLSKNVNKTTNENENCLKFVNHQLNELEYQLKRYQTELNMKANYFQGYTLTMQKMIETYLEQNLQSFRMEIEHRIELVHYDYQIRAFKLEYFRRHKPNIYQVCFL